MPLKEEFINLKGQVDNLDRQLKELKEKKEVIDPEKPFKDIPFDPIRKIKTLHAGLPVLTSVPTYTGLEGEIVLVVTGGIYYTYSYISSVWRIVGQAATTTGLTQILTVRNSAGDGTCTITVVKGLITATTC